MKKILLLGFISISLQAGWSVLTPSVTSGVADVTSETASTYATLTNDLTQLTLIKGNNLKNLRTEKMKTLQKIENINREISVLLSSIENSQKKITDLEEE